MYKYMYIFIYNKIKKKLWSKLLSATQAIIFKPDARLQKPKKKRNGLGEVQPLGEERLFGGNVF